VTTGGHDIDIADAIVLHFDGEDLSHVPAQVRRAVDTLVPFVAAARREQANLAAAEVPPLDQDPIAIALGLVPGPADVLSSTRLRAARKRAGLKLTDVVAVMNARGWDLALNSLFDWEQAPVPAAPALIAALAETVGVAADELREPRVTVDDQSVEFDDPSVVVAIADWASSSGKSTASLQSQVRRSVQAAAARNRTTLDQAFVLKVIEVLRATDQPLR
jgi:hypothetical protein